MQLRVSQMTEKTMVMSLTCAKGTDTMVRLCEIFESLNLNIISATFTAFSERLIITIFLEVWLHSFYYFYFSLWEVIIRVWSTNSEVGFHKNWNFFGGRNINHTQNYLRRVCINFL